MSAQADELRRELSDLFERRAAGDVPARTFERKLVEAQVALSRAVIAERLAPEESILAEHHFVHSHFKLTGSVLQEPAQAAVSFFATQRRLLRLRSTLLPGRPPSCDEADDTVVDELAYTGIAGLMPRKQVRWGEAGAGLAITAIALLLGNALAVTGSLLVLLGIAGVLHGLLLPTRWIEISTSDRRAQPPFEIHATRRKSGRGLVAVVRACLRKEEAA
jgi:hypothetical protein